MIGTARVTRWSVFETSEGEGSKFLGKYGDSVPDYMVTAIFILTTMRTPNIAHRIPVYLKILY
jgi:hypothetical protein